MGDSQLACLEDSYVNKKISESRADYFYSEQQRLAVEKLVVEEGESDLKEVLKESKHFISPKEAKKIRKRWQRYGEGKEGDGGEVEDGSLTYWPEKSDTPIPMLDLGWLDSVAYRGVTRVAVHTHPPKYGEPFIKEIIRNLIQGASKMIALVMDDLTDVNIFQDLLEASYKRLIPVYIILQHSSLDGFLHMCCSLQLNHLLIRKLRVRSISGLGLGLSSGQVRGDLAHKFIFVDGDKVVSGSYSYTWSYWRLHRCVVTMLTGQAVESFDTLFRELYADSAPVDLHVRLGIQKGFSHFQALPRASNSPPHSDHLKRKLYNPKYQLVISNRSSSTGELGPGGLELKPENSVLTRERRGSTLTRSKKETDDEEKRNQTIMDWLQRYDVKGLEEPEPDPFTDIVISRGPGARPAPNTNPARKSTRKQKRAKEEGKEDAKNPDENRHRALSREGSTTTTKSKKKEKCTVS